MTADLRTQLAEVLLRTSQRWVRSELYPYQADVLAAEVMPLIADTLAAARAEGAAEARKEAVSEFNRLAAEIRDEAEDADDEPTAWSLGVIALRAEVIGELLGTIPALSAHTTEGDPT